MDECVIVHNYTKHHQGYYHAKVKHVCIKIKCKQSAAHGEGFTCIVPETTPVRKSPVLVVVILPGHFVLLLEAGKIEERI